MRLVKAAKASPNAKFYSLSTGYTHYAMIQYRDGIGEDFLNPPRPVNFKILRRDRPVFNSRFFVRCSMHLMKNFQKGGMGEVLKFVTPHGQRVANEPTSSGPKPARA